MRRGALRSAPGNHDQPQRRRLREDAQEPRVVKIDALVDRVDFDAAQPGGLHAAQLRPPVRAVGMDGAERIQAVGAVEPDGEVVQMPHFGRIGRDRQHDRPIDSGAAHLGAQAVCRAVGGRPQAGGDGQLLHHRRGDGVGVDVGVGIDNHGEIRLRWEIYGCRARFEPVSARRRPKRPTKRTENLLYNYTANIGKSQWVFNRKMNHAKR